MIWMCLPENIAGSGRNTFGFFYGLTFSKPALPFTAYWILL
ncbi:MAG: hypothetical protein JWQ57_1104 [Mucilaginibacter sp.]|nr:hypothetical protein [Mucilaginibacter sp.]